ncbi:MAG: SDR family NAD(P)-dependent oxidoreductase [Actinobacteria bacterium]|nr:SDR family NAD(P)-dependent oxidoreductase [Actinomycetota bacterium]
MTNDILTIIGMGQGISLAVAKRFAKEGFSVAMISRTKKKLEHNQTELNKMGYDARYFIADACSEASLKSAMAKIKEEIGDTNVLVYNAANVVAAFPSQITFDDLVNDFKVNVAGALVATQEVLPAMAANKKGTIIYTGGGLSIRPYKDYTSLAIGKAGIRSLAHTFAQELKTEGIHVATVTVREFVRSYHEKYNPTSIAEEFWKLHIQPRGKFKTEVIY